MEFKEGKLDQKRLFPGRFDLKKDNELIANMPKFIIYYANRDPFKYDAIDLIRELKQNVVNHLCFDGDHAFYMESQN